MYALIVSHGQPSDPGPAETALARLALRIARHLPGWSVQSATMAMPGRLEVQARQSPPGTHVYPLFMADGWFVRTRLRQRLNGHDMAFCPPLGLEPGLPALAAGLLTQQAHRQGWEINQTPVVLPAHGSARSDLAAQATRDFADRLQPLIPDTPLHLGFVEQAPSITQAATGHGSRAISLPFFAAAGGHALEDVPQELDAAQFTGQRLPVLGLAPGIPALIADSLRAAQASAAASRAKDSIPAQSPA